MTHISFCKTCNYFHSRLYIHKVYLLSEDRYAGILYIVSNLAYSNCNGGKFVTDF
jgi:hypothetical protein